MNVIKLLLLFTAIVLFAAACDSTAPAADQTTNSAVSKASPAGNTSPANVVAVQPQQQSATGKELFAENCMICHKEDGTGGKVTIKGKNLKAENLTEDKLKKASDEKLIGYIRDGVPDEGMPAFGDELTDEQIEQVVQHVRSLQQ